MGTVEAPGVLTVQSYYMYIYSTINTYTRVFIHLHSDEDAEALHDRLKQQQRDAARRENTLVHRLTTKEQELQDFMVRI